MHGSSSLLSTFVTLFVTIGPIETAVIFAGLTTGIHHAERLSLSLRSVAIAGLMLLLFAVGGNTVLSLLHVSLPAFRVAGGMLLFLQALTLTFSSPGLSSINDRERQDAEKAGDIAVFPLAFPLIASPGALSAVVLLTGRAEGWHEGATIIAMIVLCLIITYAAMRVADTLLRLLGQTGADVVGRISGILLAGLAVQFILDGLRGEFPNAFGSA
ncbi:MarC family protein [Bradyrhizobium sp. NFR13]|uniref:MarC family protein n=1 Tax=Bradyrhizobium sp. NFR13 TaxID=1566285 RepID=UPI000B8623F3|nr:MarC family protein [Bradyrhizobium sp. NFR13]